MQNETLLSVRITTADKNISNIRKQGSKVKTVNTVTLVTSVTKGLKLLQSTE